LIALRQKIDLYRPKVVLFCGSSPEYRLWWNEIARDAFTAAADPQIVEREGSLFTLIKYPVAHGVPNSYFDEIGREIRLRITR
jgi:hypothetical protein